MVSTFEACDGTMMMKRRARPAIWYPIFMTVLRPMGSKKERRLKCLKKWWPPRWPAGVPLIQAAPTAQQQQAASRLQKSWRHYKVDPNPALAGVVYCPVLLRRSLVDGTRIPRPPKPSALAAPPATDTPAALPTLLEPLPSTAGAPRAIRSSPRGRHFMSIL